MRFDRVEVDDLAVSTATAADSFCLDSFVEDTSTVESYLEVEPSKILLATCNLNNWALDFDGNLARTFESLRQSKEMGARYRLGPELELSGYSCEDHFLELDTFLHCEQSLVSLLKSDISEDFLCDVGMPMMIGSVRYNCRVLFLNHQIVLIRPKMILANDGNYREKRYFAQWQSGGGASSGGEGVRQVGSVKLITSGSLGCGLEEVPLSALLRKTTGQSVVPFGNALIRTAETTLSIEMCEELWVPKAPHLDAFLAGAEIVSNGSGSHHELRKLNTRLQLMRQATHQCGGVYMYANHRGGDGGRLYFDGSCMIAMNGHVLRQGSQFSLKDVEVQIATVDLNRIRSYRGGQQSFQSQSGETSSSLPIIDLTHFSLQSEVSRERLETHATLLTLPIPEEECCKGPACWLWDYIRRSGAGGFLLPLSGGVDSSAVAAIVGVMCHMVASESLSGNCQVRSDVDVLHKKHMSGSPLNWKIFEQIAEDEGYEKAVAKLANYLANYILNTVYMGTDNSSINTLTRAKDLAQEVGSYHNSIRIDIVVNAFLTLFQMCTGKTPKFVLHGGSITQDLAIQNIQARVRMVTAYLFAQLLPWVRGADTYLLVLSSGNVDELLRGYLTKYDCSSADLNPIGGMSKADLYKMLLWVSDKYKFGTLAKIAHAPPSAELRPLGDAVDGESSQRDEDEMGMSYNELSVYGRLRKVDRCGPVMMFVRLLSEWGIGTLRNLSPSVIADKVKTFFRFYSINRHKSTTITPSYHAENYSPDDNRYDLRPFLYNTRWTRQFSTIDNLVKQPDQVTGIPK